MKISNMKLACFLYTLFFKADILLACHQANSRERSFGSKKVVEYFSNCLNQNAGRKYNWQAISNFVVDDTIWYSEAEREFCKSDDSSSCWKNEMDFLIDPFSPVSEIVKRCVQSYEGEDVYYSMYPQFEYDNSNLLGELDIPEFQAFERDLSTTETPVAETTQGPKQIVTSGSVSIPITENTNAGFTYTVAPPTTVSATETTIQTMTNYFVTLTEKQVARSGRRKRDLTREQTFALLVASYQQMLRQQQLQRLRQQQQQQFRGGQNMNNLIRSGYNTFQTIPNQHPSNNLSNVFRPEPSSSPPTHHPRSEPVSKIYQAIQSPNNYPPLYPQPSPKTYRYSHQTQQQQNNPNVYHENQPSGYNQPPAAYTYATQPPATTSRPSTIGYNEQYPRYGQNNNQQPQPYFAQARNQPSPYQQPLPHYSGGYNPNPTYPPPAQYTTTTTAASTTAIAEADRLREFLSRIDLSSLSPVDRNIVILLKAQHTPTTTTAAPTMNPKAIKRFLSSLSSLVKYGAPQLPGPKPSTGIVSPFVTANLCDQATMDAFIDCVSKKLALASERIFGFSAKSPDEIISIFDFFVSNYSKCKAVRSWDNSQRKVVRRCSRPMVVARSGQVTCLPTIMLSLVKDGKLKDTFLSCIQQ